MSAQKFSMTEHPQGLVLWLSALQWFFFMLVSCLIIPVVLAHDLGLTISGTSMYIAKTLLTCGLVAIAQALFGHHLPILEGPSGLWWGVFLVLIETTKQVGGNLDLMQRDLQMGLLISGLLLVLLVVFRLMDLVAKLFNPVVTGTYMILLTLQMSSSIITGIFGIGYEGRTTVDWTITLLSIVVIALVNVVSMKARGWMRSFSILFGIVVGWALFAAFGLAQFRTGGVPFVQIPGLFPFGTPHFQLGIALTCVVTVLVLLSNVIASLGAMREVVSDKLPENTMSRGTLVTGLGTMVSGLFGVIGNVPIASAAGFVSLTRIASRRPFLISGLALVVLGFLPKVDLMVANIPGPVAYSILLIIFAEMFSMGIKMVMRGMRTQSDAMGVGISVLAGLGFQLMPVTAWGGISTSLAYLLHNGLIVGVVMILLFQNIGRREDVTESHEDMERGLVPTEAGASIELASARLTSANLGVARTNSQRRAPGEPASSAGKPASPSGEPASPVGKLASPAGKLASPSGEPASPAEKLASPSGKFASSAGKPASSAGKPASGSRRSEKLKPGGLEPSERTRSRSQERTTEDPDD